MLSVSAREAASFTCKEQGAHVKGRASCKPLQTLRLLPVRLGLCKHPVQKESSVCMISCSTAKTTAKQAQRMSRQRGSNAVYEWAC